MQTVNLYRERVAAGGEPAAVFAAVKAASRDRSRSPYQWSAAPNAGFSTARPWLGVNPNYVEINLERELADPASVFHYYRRLIALRKATPALIYGEFVAQAAPAALFVYRRRDGDDEFEVALNLSDQPVAYTAAGELLLGNYPAPEKTRLQPYEARVLRISNCQLLIANC